MADFSGKVVIVTGGALGMGGVTPEEFARYGANVLVADLNLDAGEAIEGKIRADGNSAVFVEADVADSRQCQRVVERAVSELPEENSLVIRMLTLKEDGEQVIAQRLREILG